MNNIPGVAATLVVRSDPPFLLWFSIFFSFPSFLSLLVLRLQQEWNVSMSFFFFISPCHINRGRVVVLVSPAMAFALPRVRRAQSSTAFGVIGRR